MGFGATSVLCSLCFVYVCPSCIQRAACSNVRLVVRYVRRHASVYVPGLCACCYCGMMYWVTCSILHLFLNILRCSVRERAAWHCFDAFECINRGRSRTLLRIRQPCRRVPPFFPSSSRIFCVRLPVAHLTPRSVATPSLGVLMVPATGSLAPLGTTSACPPRSWSGLCLGCLLLGVRWVRWPAAFCPTASRG